LSRPSLNGAAASAAGQAAIPNGRKFGVLVVDDEPAVRALLEAALLRQGYAVWLAADGREALAVYRRFRQEISLVLLDVRMPLLDGPQTLVALQEISPGICCCFMSGQSGNYTTTELADLGVSYIFKKPFRLAEVLKSIDQLTREASTSARTEAFL
jgi:DNA-binding response OmpR family regulator